MKMKIVYTSGTFDILHSNHLKMIKYARGIADILIVGVSTDELVCTYKDAPAMPFEERLEIIEALKYPDVVIPQKSLDHTELVRNLNINAFVVGSDWTGKYDYLRDLGIEVYYFPYGDGITSTKLKESIYSTFNTIKEKSDRHDHPTIK